MYITETPSGSTTCNHYAFTFTGKGVDDNKMSTESISAMLMLILQNCEDNRLHSMFIEALLPLHANLYKEIFCVVAYGPPNTCIPAITLLFHYWPQLARLLSPPMLRAPYDVLPWSLPVCQRTKCINIHAQPLASKVDCSVHTVWFCSCGCSAHHLLYNHVICDFSDSTVFNAMVKYHICNFMNYSTYPTMQA